MSVKSFPLIHPILSDLQLNDSSNCNNSNNNNGNKAVITNDVIIELLLLLRQNENSSRSGDSSNTANPSNIQNGNPSSTDVLNQLLFDAIIHPNDVQNAYNKCLQRDSASCHGDTIENKEVGDNEEKVEEAEEEEKKEEEKTELGAAVKAEEIVEDEDILTKLLKLTMCDETVPKKSDVMEYKGKAIQSKARDVLVHVVDNMEDHFGENQAPNVSFKLTGMKNLGYNQRFFSKSDPVGDRWFSDVSVHYNLSSGTCESSIFAVDDMYFDFAKMVTKTGSMVKNYGTTWMNVYFPEATTAAFSKSFLSSTNWYISERAYAQDENQKLHSFSVNIDNVDRPKVESFMDEMDEENRPTGKMAFVNKGVVQDIFSNPGKGAIYKGTGFFSVSMNVITPFNRFDAPKPSVECPCKVKFTLLRARIFSKATRINPIRLGQNSGAKNF